MRGHGEDDPEILDALVKLFRAAPKCNAIRQHWLCIRGPFDSGKLYNWTPLYMIAQEELSIVYNRFASSTINGQDVELETPDSRDEDGETLLHLAVIEGHKDLVELLLSVERTAYL